MWGALNELCYRTARTAPSSGEDGAYEIEKMSPWQFAGLFADMIDAGVRNTGEGETYFRNMRQAQMAVAA